CGVEVGELKVRDFTFDENVLSGEVMGKPTSKPAKAKATGERIYAERVVAGLPTRDILAEVLPRVLLGISWAKTMKWGSGIGPWVRPVHGVAALLAGDVVPFELFGVAAGRETVGHPTLSPAPFSVVDSADYRAQLAARDIEVRFDVRCQRLAEAMAARATAA